MILVYLREKHPPSNRMKKWFDQYADILDFEYIYINDHSKVTNQEITEIVQLGDLYFDTVVGFRAKQFHPEEVEELYDLPYSKAITYLADRPYLLHLPLAHNHNILQCTADVQGLERFLPSEYRQHLVLKEDGSTRMERKKA